MKTSFFIASVLLASINIFAGQLIDGRDKKTYRTIQVGNVEWMAENLNYATQKSRCINDKPESCAMFGRLYFHENVESGVCSDGWDLPTNDDVVALSDMAIKAFRQQTGNPNRETKAGMMLKAKKQPATYTEWKAGIQEWSISNKSIDILEFRAMLFGYYDSEELEDIWGVVVNCLYIQIVCKEFDSKIQKLADC